MKQADFINARSLYEFLDQLQTFFGVVAHSKVVIRYVSRMFGLSFPPLKIVFEFVDYIGEYSNSIFAELLADAALKKFAGLCQHYFGRAVKELYNISHR